MTTKADFSKFLVTLAAAIPRWAPNTGDNSTLETWYAELGHLELEDLRRVYKLAVASFDQFPSMREVLQLVGQALPTPTDVGREVAERIYGAIGRYGSMLGESGKKKWAEQILPFIGPVGAEVVNLSGGWNHLCEVVTDAEATTWKAQWRGEAEAAAKRGPRAEPPGWTSLPTRPEIVALTDGLNAMRKP